MTASGVQYCYSSPGIAARQATFKCGPGKTCTSNASESWCAPAQCRPGADRCGGAGVQTCGANGSWGAVVTCATGCRTSAIGAYCPPAGATNTVTGTLLYATKNPNTQLTGWATPSSTPSNGALVISVNAANQWIDATETAPDGTFSIKVAQAPAPTDRIVFAAAGGDGTSLLYSVRDPNNGAGTFQPLQFGAMPRLWSWALAASTFVSGSTFALTEAQGAAALNLFDMQRLVWKDSLRTHGGKQGLSLSIWFALNTEWSCGACFADYPTQDGIDSQLFIGGGATDQSYWSDWVTTHELGHWRMASYGTSPGEGGTHILSIKTFPGQAYSEGWATYHAAAVQNNPIAFDIQGGAFWIDFDQRLYSFGPSAIPRAVASQPLDQRIDENDVAAMLWNLSRSSPSAVPFIHQMMGSEHMNASPWSRGYKRHTWDIDKMTGMFTNVVVTADAAPFLADLMDAMICGGFSTTAMSGATVPASFFPYNAAGATCAANRCYGCRETNGTCVAAPSATQCGRGGSACAVCASNQTCTNGVCL